MKHVQESLYQFEDDKFFKSLFEAEETESGDEEPMSTQDKKKAADNEKKKVEQIKKEGLAVVKKLYKNWALFKSVANGKMQSYRDFWAEQKNADETIGQEGMFYNLYDSDYIVGVVKNPAGKAEMKVYNTSASSGDMDEFETFVCGSDEVMKEFTKFFKGDVEGEMKTVISNHKAAVKEKKKADKQREAEETEAKKKAKLDAFLGEAKEEKTKAQTGKFVIVKANGGKYIVNRIPLNSKKAVGSKKYGSREAAQTEADKMNKK